MKFYKYIFFISLFFVIISDNCDEFNTVPKEKSECFGMLSEEQKVDELKVHCCYSKAESRSYPWCQALTQMQYEHIKDYIKFNEILWADVNLNIDCKSFYIKMSLFYLLLFLL